MEVRSTCRALSSMSFCPTPVEPVNESLRSRGSSVRGPLISAGCEVVRTLSTPSGNPAWPRISARASMDSGVWWAGLTIMVQPAATAGPILRVPIAMGKFHGVISSAGPTGWRITQIRPLPSGAVRQPPSMRTASSENQRKNSAA